MNTAVVAIGCLAAGIGVGWSIRGAWTRAGVHVRPIRGDHHTTVGWRAYLGNRPHIGLGNTTHTKAEAERIADHAREAL